jgi:hypothetical protein
MDDRDERDERYLSRFKIILAVGFVAVIVAVYLSFMILGQAAKNME